MMMEYGTSHGNNLLPLTIDCRGFCHIGPNSAVVDTALGPNTWYSAVTYLSLCASCKNMLEKNLSSIIM